MTFKHVVRPIPFSGEMVRAILSGRKTQTRRLVKIGDMDGALRASPDPGERDWVPWLVGEILPSIRCPYGIPGDRLWVREAVVRQIGRGDHGDGATYEADGEWTTLDTWPWKLQRLPPMFMPRGLSRISLRVTSVRLERLQAITDADAKAEGMYPAPFCEWMPPGNEHREKFAGLWGALHGKKAPWDSDPWVWVIGFERLSDVAERAA